MASRAWEGPAPSPPDEDSRSLSAAWRLPFLQPRVVCGLIRRADIGCCVQGNHGASSHHGELRFAFDWAMPVGTPVLAAREGVVAAVCDHFRAHGRRVEDKAKANYVAVRHSDGLYSRYYHLKHGGARVALGERVEQGQLIALSGNTGFSGGPHLHFDVTDRLPTDLAKLSLMVAEAEGEATAEAWECNVAGFSGDLPEPGASIRARAVWAEPRNAREPALRNAAEALGACVLIERCADVDFWDKVRRSEAAGAAMAIVVNNEPCEVLHIMAVPKRLREESHGTQLPRVAIPAIMISRAAGLAIGEMAARSQGNAFLDLRRTDHCPKQLERSDGSISPYAPLTQPVRFMWRGHPEGYLPMEGKFAPKGVNEPDAEARHTKLPYSKRLWRQRFVRGKL
ncbi:hypothetical protein AB1Y20_001389 [Prymnesium parvum]|uniref:Peptidase M23 domain-containing protein n=1 Tax=Prymnesium parvum TaxID=97485 RepID=A0AB34IDT6_PRYPA